MKTIPAGTRYKTRGKHPRICTVIDMHVTYNLAGEVVKVGYVTQHELGGQIITERDVCETTIAMGLLAKEQD